jgi:hypothetical protein
VAPPVHSIRRHCGGFRISSAEGRNVAATLRIAQVGLDPLSHEAAATDAEDALGFEGIGLSAIRRRTAVRVTLRPLPGGLLQWSKVGLEPSPRQNEPV